VFRDGLGQARDDVIAEDATWYRSAPASGCAARDLPAGSGPVIAQHEAGRRPHRVAPTAITIRQILDGKGG
jgi:hypothetical protein